MRKPPHVRLIGLTGGVACGKSTVLERIERLGAAVIDADQIVHRLQAVGQPVYHAIVAAFGEAILHTPGGPIDRPALAGIVFSNPSELARLEVIVHPAVRDELQRWIDWVGQSAAHPIAVIDAIKLLESPWSAQCEAIWVVACDEAQQIARMVANRNMSEEEARRRIAAQPPQASRFAAATRIIENSGSREATLAQIDAAWADFLAKGASHG